MGEYDSFAENAKTIRAWIDFSRQRPDQVRQRASQISQQAKPAREPLEAEFKKMKKLAKNSAGIRPDSSTMAVSRPQPMERGKKVNPGFRF